jgi:hypothetical protein
MAVLSCGCQNEVERTQAAVGRAIVHGGSIKWKPKCIEENDAKQLTFDEYEKLEEEMDDLSLKPSRPNIIRRVKVCGR